ncbi:MAG: cytochrome c peroxidase [Novosphingobium sp.]
MSATGRALFAGLGLLAAVHSEAVAEHEAGKPVLWASVSPTIETALPPARGDLRLLLLSAPLTEDQASGPATERLAEFAGKTGLIVGAPVIEPMAGHDGICLSLTLVAPNGTVLIRNHAATPVVPITGVAFAHREFSAPLTTAVIGGFRLGIAAIGDADVAIPRLSDLGADLVLLTGGPVNRTQAARFAATAQVNRVSLLIAGHCTGTFSCAAFTAVDTNGKVDRASTGRHVFIRRSRWTPRSARGLPESVPRPMRLSGSPQLAELGRVLFFDKRLSRTRSVSCASCHDPMLGFADGRPQSSGVLGRSTSRNAISLLNVAFRPTLRWDNYASSLENFIKYPLSGHDEMASHDLDGVAARIGRSRRYRAQFASIFGPGNIRFDQIERALAAYMRTLVSGNSPFDRAMAEDRRDAMTDAAWRGLALFRGRAGCASCHTYSEQSPFFTDFQAHNTGLGWDVAASQYRDAGAGAIGGHALMAGFRTPTLRDVARTGPYMHDGSIATLRGVVDYFDRGGGDGPGRDPRLHALHLSERDKQDLEAFLIALTGTTRFDRAGRRTERHLAENR